MAIDFFCGCGGVSHGLIKAGVEVVAGLDNDPNVKYAYEDNNKNAKFYLCNLHDTKQTSSIVKKILCKHKWDILVFAACAPCQPFSLHNKKFRRRKDLRKNLMLKFIEVIKMLPQKMQPSFVLAENVSAMKKRGKSILNTVQKMLANLNYKMLEPKIINAAEFEVPQNRRRLIVIAAKNGRVKNQEKFSWTYFYNKYKDEPIAVRTAISHLPSIPAGHKINKKDQLHITRELSSLNLRRIMSITKDGCGREMWKKRYGLKCYRKHDGHKDVYGRMKWDAPAPTLTCKCISISNGRFGHPEQHRGISLREAAILQTMGDYNFRNPILINRVTKQIGNAVPPNLIEKLSNFIIELNKLDIKS